VLKPRDQHGWGVGGAAWLVVGLLSVFTVLVGALWHQGWGGTSRIGGSMGGEDPGQGVDDLRLGGIAGTPVNVVEGRAVVGVHGAGDLHLPRDVLSRLVRLVDP